MHLETARRDQLLETHRRWGDAAQKFFQVCMQCMGSRDPEADGALVLCVITGLQLGDLAGPNEHLERDVLGPLFRRLLHGLIP